MALDEETMLDLSNMITYDLRIKFDPLVFALRRKADASVVDKLRADMAAALSSLGAQSTQLDLMKRMLEAGGGGGGAPAAAASSSRAAAQAEEEAVAFETVRFFKVAFSQAVDLVKRRHVLLRGGFAYVPHGRMLSIVQNRFKAYLNYATAMANRYLPGILQDERLAPLLKNMSTSYTGAEYGAGGRRPGAERVGPEDVQGLAQTAFPLCMQTLHEGLAQNHHLRHGGRMQYGLFLKGVGLALEDALVFWQKEFTKSMSADDFVKKYAYNIRHNYGKEGKRADYTAYSCTRIILGAPPGQGDFHGCPFKSWDASRLRTVLQRMRLSAAQVDDVVRDASNKDYQLACRRQFEARFPQGAAAGEFQAAVAGVVTGGVGNHPNGCAYLERWDREGERAKGPCLYEPRPPPARSSLRAAR